MAGGCAPTGEDCSHCATAVGWDLYCGGYCIVSADYICTVYMLTLTSSSQVYQYKTTTWFATSGLLPANNPPDSTIPTLVLSNGLVVSTVGVDETTILPITIPPPTTIALTTSMTSSPVPFTNILKSSSSKSSSSSSSPLSTTHSSTTTSSSLNLSSTPSPTSATASLSTQATKPTLTTTTTIGISIAAASFFFLILIIPFADRRWRRNRRCRPSSSSISTFSGSTFTPSRTFSPGMITPRREALDPSAGYIEEREGGKKEGWLGRLEGYFGGGGKGGERRRDRMDSEGKGGGEVEHGEGNGEKMLPSELDGMQMVDAGGEIGTLVPGVNQLGSLKAGTRYYREMEEWEGNDGLGQRVELDATARMIEGGTERGAGEEMGKRE